MGASIDAPVFSLTYRVERHEVGTWYRRSFFKPRGLWGYWAVAVPVVAVLAWVVQQIAHPFGSSTLLAVIAVTILLLFFFVMFPQAPYKSQERTMRVSEKGISTTVGDVTSPRAWADVSSITDYGDFIAIVIAGGVQFGPAWIRTRNGNAFVIPNRAFINPNQREYFLEQVRKWHAQQGLRFPRFAASRYYADIDPEPGVVV